jgi:hypothetical protein
LCLSDHRITRSPDHPITGSPDQVSVISVNQW